MKHFAIFILASLCLACDPKATTETTTKESSADPKSGGISKIELDDWKIGKKNTYRLSDQLVLAIPAKFQGEIGWKLPRPSFNYKSLPIFEQAGFSMFMPDFSGYTAENIDNQFHTDKVQVVWIMPADPKQAELGAPGYFPPNMLLRVLDQSRFTKLTYVDKFGLRCYSTPQQEGQLNLDDCFGTRDGEHVHLAVNSPPYPSHVLHPTMQARYFTPRYGGVNIIWRTHNKNLAQWEAIDRQIWKFVQEWNIADSVNRNITK